MDTVWWLCPALPTETLKWLSSLPILMQKSFWWWQCSDRFIISLSPHLHTPFPPFSPSLISRTVSVDVKHHVYLKEKKATKNLDRRVGAVYWLWGIWLDQSGYRSGPWGRTPTGTALAIPYPLFINTCYFVRDLVGSKPWSRRGGCCGHFLGKTVPLWDGPRKESLSAVRWDGMS